MVLASGCTTSVSLEAPWQPSQGDPVWVVQQRLDRAQDLVLVGNWRPARREVNGATREILTRLRGGSRTTQLLGQLSFVRALVAASAGEAEAAAWDFHVACHFAESYRRIDLSRYGELAPMLEAGRPVAQDRARKPDEVVDPSRMVLPRKIKTPFPDYPLAHRLLCEAGSIKVSMVINSKGRPVRPTVESRYDPVLAFAAFEAVRNWHFEPAYLDGKPVPAYYNLTVNYQVAGGCRR